MMKSAIAFNIRGRLCTSGLVLVALLAYSTAAAAQRALWTDITTSPDKVTRVAAQASDNESPWREVALDLTGMIEHLAQASPEGVYRKARSASTPIEVELPLPEGGFETFSVYAATVMSAELAAKFPDIRTFAGVSIRNPSTKLRLDHTPAGLHAQVLGLDIRWHIDPLSSSSNTRYRSYNAKSMNRSGRGFQCLLENQTSAGTRALAPNQQQRAVARSSGDTLRTYRLAVATTGEYGLFHGGTVGSALAAVVTTINRVVGIYQQELAIELVLVADNNKIIFTDPDVDPFDGNADSDVLIYESQEVIDETIGSSNYDIGHTFSTGAGGVAVLGAACNAGIKARGVTGRATPQGDPFDVDFVAHEIGHQFGGSHTFNGSNGNCRGGNRVPSAAYEPGSGSTIQAYAGICGADNLQNNSDPIFHSASFDEIIAHANAASNANCGTSTATGNTPPSVEAGPDFTIPHSTPFLLEGFASDTDGDTLTYLWEQRDLGSQQSLAAPDDGLIPLFRVFTPTLSPIRFLPRLSSLASGVSSTSEKLPTQPRTMDWRLTVRDTSAGGGGVNSDNMTVEVVATGPFALVSPNGGETVSGDQLVSWDVASTNAIPVNASHVEFFLSTDGGQSFDLSAPLNVAVNDGSATVSFPPALSSSTVRLMIKAQDNIFFDVSDSDFTVKTTGAPGTPILISVTPGDGRATFDFTPGTEGSSPTTSFTANCEAQATASGGAEPGQPINGASVLTSSINIPDSGIIRADALTVDVDITHDWRGDIQLQLSSPSGTMIELKQDNDTDSANDVVGSFPSTLTPVESLNAFFNEPITGNWLLSVNDTYPDADDGFFNSWAINIDYPDTATATGEGPPLVVSGLTNGITYSCELYGSNISGPGTAASVFVAPNNLPPAQPAITSVESGDAELVVRFIPGSNGGPLTGYTVTCGNVSQSGSGSPITVPGLTNNQEYICTVVATNQFGSSAVSAPASATPAETTMSGLPVWLLWYARQNDGN